MRVTSEVRLDQATWSSNARTLRVVMKETSEMRLWRKLVSHARAWDRLHCPYLGLNRCCRAEVNAVAPKTMKDIHVKSTRSVMRMTKVSIPPMFKWLVSTLDDPVELDYSRSIFR